MSWIRKRIAKTSLPDTCTRSELDCGLRIADCALEIGVLEYWSLNDCGLKIK